MPTPHTIRTPMLLQCIVLLLASLLFPQLAQAAPDKRVALLIGNAKYTSGLPPLSNPPKDTAALEASLKKLNFSVQRITDGDQKAMGRAIKQFGTDAQDAQVAFFYYSGHGMQARDENYLIPIAAQIETEAELDGEAINLRGVLRQLEDARPQNAVIVLDACRDNPVASKSKNASKGLSRVQSQPTNTLVVFAAQAGTTASDNGVFAKALASHITQPNVGMRVVFDNVGKAVRSASGNKQSIQRDDQLSEDIVLLASVGVVPNTVQIQQGGTPPQPLPQRADPEEDTWEFAKRRDSIQSYQAYLNAYPQGRYVTPARAALEGLKPVVQTAVPVSLPSQVQVPVLPANGPVGAVGFKKPITVIVPFAAGGGLDLEARLLAPLLSTQLGVPVLVENVAGSGGVIGVKKLMNAPADGHTLMLHNTSFISSARALPPGQAGYQPAVDLQPLGMVSEAPLMLVTRTGIGLPQVKVFASGGVGSLSQGCTQQQATARGLSWVHVPYRGTGPALTDLMSGQVDAMCETASTLLPFVNSGKLQVAGLTSAAGGLLPQFSGFGRLPAPTSGAVSLWTGLFAPKGTPDGVINRLSQALFRLNEDTSYKQQQASQGRSVIVDTRQTVAGHSQFLAEDVSRWATVRMD